VLRIDWKTAALAASLGEDRPGGVGDSFTFRSKLFTR
jgi:hypothetical protein